MARNVQAKSIRSWTEAELAYFAGIVDGEGCFATANHPDGIYTQFRVANTDPMLMEWISVRFGGVVLAEKRRPGHMQVWRWLASSADIDRILPSLIPYLIIKKRQAELTLAFRRTLARAGGRVTPEMRQKRERIQAEMQVLKRPHLAVTA